MKEYIRTNSINGIELIGRIALGSGEVEGLFEKYTRGTNDYIEIGTLFGGSAILAGLQCSGKVYCIDPLDGYYGTGNPDSSQVLPSVEIVKENWARFGLDPERLVIFPHKHPPFPPELKDKRFDVAYIDGDHTFEGCRADWLALKDRVNKYIIFDNTEKESVRRVFEEAQQQGWEFAEEVGDSITTGVIRKINKILTLPKGSGGRPTCHTK